MLRAARDELIGGRARSAGHADAAHARFRLPSAMPLFTDHADVSVRPAVPGDETPIARVQLAAWRDEHADVLGR